MTIKRITVALTIFSFFLSVNGVQAAVAQKNSQELNATHNSKGQVTSRSFDNHPDGKVDYWIFYEKGKIIRQEWDRNFDGKADLRIVSDGNRLRYKEYDHNFDGKFEKKEWPLPHGNSGRIKTTASENDLSTGQTG